MLLVEVTVILACRPLPAMVVACLCLYTQTHGFTMPSAPVPAAATRWNLVISGQTNAAVRTFLAQTGFKKGDLSAFVEEAVRRRVFDQVMGEDRGVVVTYCNML